MFEIKHLIFILLCLVAYLVVKMNEYYNFKWIGLKNLVLDFLLKVLAILMILIITIVLFLFTVYWVIG